MTNNINLPGFTAEVSISKNDSYNRHQVSTYDSQRSRKIVMQVSIEYLRCIANNCQGSFATEMCYDLCDFSNSGGEDGGAGSGNVGDNNLWEIYCSRGCHQTSHNRQSLIECLRDCRD